MIDIAFPSCSRQKLVRCMTLVLSSLPISMLLKKALKKTS